MDGGKPMDVGTEDGTEDRLSTGGMSTSTMGGGGGGSI